MMKPAMRIIVAGVAITALISASGCTPDQPLPPPPTTPTSAATTTTISAIPAPRPTVAPPVTRTLDLRPYHGRPCDLLTAEQIANLGLPAQPPPEMEVREMCRWPVGVSGRNVTLQMVMGYDYLGQAYAESNKMGEAGTGPLTWGLFEPRIIAAQPAVVRASTPGPLACEVVVGVGPNQGFLLIVGGGAVIDVCAKGVAVAEEMIKTLGG